MDIRVKSQSHDDRAADAGITFEVVLEHDDVAQLTRDAARAREIDRHLPPEARTPLADADDDAYIYEFVRTRAVNDALEIRGIVPVAAPKVKASALVEGEPFTCELNVVIRPDIGLTSLEPVEIATNRIAKPGFSAKAARDGDGDAEFLDDEKVLRLHMVNRLDSELPDTAIRALADEYKARFERELAANNIDPESYQLAHGLNEEQYELMMARRALSDAHWNYALDAVFTGNGFTVSRDDLVFTYELECPGFGEQLFELHDLRNDLYLAVEKYRRGKALMWLKDNAIR